MIPVENLIYGIDQKLNKLSTFVSQSISKEDKLLALNEAQIKLILKKLNPINNLQLGFDGNKKRYEDLQILVEPAELHSLVLLKEGKHIPKWVASLEDLKPQYMFFISAYALADKGSCTGNIIIANPGLVKHGDIHVLLNNSNYKPSFEYQETPCTITGNNIELYTDGTFEYTGIYISYIRYPKQIDEEGYEHLDGTPSIHQDSELPDYLESELLNLAVIELGFNTENIPATQASGERLKTEE